MSLRGKKNATGVGVLKDFRKEILGDWLDWKTFRRDRRLLLHQPQDAGRAQRPIKNSPLQFAIHALLPAVALVWIGEAVAALIGPLPPTSTERMIAEFERSSEEYTALGAADVISADSALASTPSWLASLDSIALGGEAIRLERRVQDLEARLPPAALSEELVAVADSIGAEARATLEQDAITAWRLALERARAVLQERVAVQDTLSVILDSLLQVAEARTNTRQRSLGTGFLGIGQQYTELRAGQLASLRVDSLFEHLGGLVLVTVLLLNSLLFSQFSRRLFPTASHDGGELYLYFMGACLVWPNVGHVLVGLGSNLLDRYEILSLAWLEAALWAGLFSWALWATGKAASLLSRVLVERDPTLDRQRAAVKVFTAVIGSQALTAIAFEIARWGATRGYVAILSG